MPEQIELVITSPEGEFLRRPATLVELATAAGQIGVMAGHERLLTTLEIGKLTVWNDRQRETFFVGGGFARVMPTRVSVLALTVAAATDDRALERCRARFVEWLDSDSG